MSTKKLSRAQIDAILSMAEKPEDFVSPKSRGKHRWNANTGLSLKRFGMVEVSLAFDSTYLFRLLPGWRPSAIELLKSESHRFSDLAPATIWTTNVDAINVARNK